MPCIRESLVHLDVERSEMEMQYMWHHGPRWGCPFPSTDGEPNQCIVSADYFSPLGADGRRVDLSNRLELTFGTVDFGVTEAYFSTVPRPQILPSLSLQSQPTMSAKNPTPMRVLFVIECSPASVENRILAEICLSIQWLLYEHHEATSENASRTLADCVVGFLTFSDTLQFYDLSVSAHLFLNIILIV